VAVLKDPSPEIREAAARALGWPGNDEAVPALRERVEAPGEAAAVKAAAVTSFGRIGDRSVRALVITATADPEASIREAALSSLALGALVDPADRTVYLIRLAEDRAVDAQSRADAVQALAKVKDERVVEALVRILESEPRSRRGMSRDGPPARSGRSRRGPRPRSSSRPRRIRTITSCGSCRSGPCSSGTCLKPIRCS
jgi:HEAT repeat protein